MRAAMSNASKAQRNILEQELLNLMHDEDGTVPPRRRLPVGNLVSVG